MDYKKITDSFPEQFWFFLFQAPTIMTNSAQQFAHLIGNSLPVPEHSA